MKKAIPVNSREYNVEGGGTIKREQGKTPNGNELNDRWVLRDAEGRPIDFDKYRNDLADRNEIDIYS